MIYEKIRVINGNPINIDGYNILITISIIINIAPNKILPFLNNISILLQFYNIPTTVDTRISVVPTFRTPSPFVSLFINTPLSNTFFLDTLFQM